jgi:hypothetical protein
MMNVLVIGKSKSNRSPKSVEDDIKTYDAVEECNPEGMPPGKAIQRNGWQRCGRDNRRTCPKPGF